MAMAAARTSSSGLILAPVKFTMRDIAITGMAGEGITPRHHTPAEPPHRCTEQMPSWHPFVF
jgi:hypothetical protein